MSTETAELPKTSTADRDGYATSISVLSIVSDRALISTLSWMTDASNDILGIFGLGSSGSSGMQGSPASSRDFLRERVTERLLSATGAISSSKSSSDDVGRMAGDDVTLAPGTCLPVRTACSRAQNLTASDNCAKTLSWPICAMKPEAEKKSRTGPLQPLKTSFSMRSLHVRCKSWSMRSAETSTSLIDEKSTMRALICSSAWSPWQHAAEAFSSRGEASSADVPATLLPVPPGGRGGRLFGASGSLPDASSASRRCRRSADFSAWMTVARK
mmetsp:Transcript_15197/g.34421  ORF Transcript_15197/g.34421 Transcript_15197/m.34421 type:complete len:272 (+) Transcript_15197:366-1181(+)